MFMVPLGASYKPALIETTDFGLREYYDDRRHTYFIFDFGVDAAWTNLVMMALRTISFWRGILGNLCRSASQYPLIV